MNKEELRSIVAQMLRELQPEAAAANAGTAPNSGTARNFGTTRNPGTAPSAPEAAAPLRDITAVDLRQEYHVPHPAKPQAFLDLKAQTPARLGLGRAGPRYRTESMLRFRADHAAAQDSVFSMVPEEVCTDWVTVQTKCKDKDEYLTRPDLGRRFDEANRRIIQEVCAGQKVLLVIGDGLSSAAITANAADCAAAIRQGLQAQGIALGKSLFVRYCRVGASDHIGDLTDCELVCLLVGERPGLVTNESMSAYLTYRPRIGISESKRTVVSNIHRQGVPAVEAGAHIASLIRRILEQKASGIDLKEPSA